LASMHAIILAFGRSEKVGKICLIWSRNKTFNNFCLALFFS
jgi:hypothetical protein